LPEAAVIALARFLEAVAILLVVGGLFALFLWMVLSAIGVPPRQERRRAPLQFEQRVLENLRRDT
jgi:hypothetical protein